MRPLRGGMPEAFHHCITQASAGKLNHARMAQTVADCAAILQSVGRDDRSPQRVHGLVLPGLRSSVFAVCPGMRVIRQRSHDESLSWPPAKNVKNPVATWFG